MYATNPLRHAPTRLTGRIGRQSVSWHMLTALPRRPAHFATLGPLSVCSEPRPRTLLGAHVWNSPTSILLGARNQRGIGGSLCLSCVKNFITLAKFYGGAGGQPKCSKCSTGWATKAHVLQTRKLEIALSGRMCEFNIFEPPNRQISVKLCMPQTLCATHRRA